MHILRRFGAPIFSITVLIGLSVLALVSFGEGFKFLVIQKEGITLRKRDGMTITFSLPWKSALDTKPNEAKALSPILGGLLGDVTNVASAILDNGSNAANDIASQGNALQSQTMADGSTQVSVVFDGGAGIVASILSEVNSIINDATGIIGGVVGDATSVLGVVIGGVTSTNSGQSTSNLSTSSSEPQEFLPMSHSSTQMPMNMTSTATLPPTLTTAGSPCPAMTTTKITPCCPAPSTVTCTVTETWHSTHYESTQTLYSFMSVFTVTCTETVSVCPLSNPYLFSQNSTTASSSNQSLIACASGVLAKRQEDCRPVSTTQILNKNMSSSCSMMVPGTTSTYSGNPIPSVASLMSSLETKANSSSTVCPNGQLAKRQEDCAAFTSSVSSAMASFTVSLPSLSSTIASIPTVTPIIASIMCADGSLVIRTQDCLNGLFGSSSSLLAFRTSPAPIVSQAIVAAAHSAGGGNSMLSSMITNVVSALSNVQGLTGDLLSTVMSDVASALAVPNHITGSVLPTGGALAVAGPGGAAAGNIVSASGDIAASAGDGMPSAGNVLPSITGGALAIAGAGGLAAGNVAPTLSGGVNTLAGNGITVAGNAGAGNILGHLETMVNGVPTLLPIVTTVLNGKPTTVPVVDMMVNGVPTMLPVVNDGAGLLTGLNGGGSGTGITKGRRRIVKRGEGGGAMLPEVQYYYCEKNPGDKPCILYGDGGWV